MTDYRDILNSVTDRVKGIAENGGVRGLYDRGAARAKLYARIARLTLELNGESDELKKVYVELGKLCYEQRCGADDGIYAALYARADEIVARLHSLEAEIQSLKDSVPTEDSAPDVNADIGDFEKIVSATEEEGTK